MCFVQRVQRNTLHSCVALTTQETLVRMEPPDQPDQPGWGARLRSIRNIITIEPAIFLQTFTWGLQSVITQNLMISKEPMQTTMS